MTEEHHYRVLGVPQTATSKEIKTRYRYLCHAFHPDKFSSDAHREAASEDFKQITSAYEALHQAHLLREREAVQTPPRQPRAEPVPPASQPHPGKHTEPPSPPRATPASSSTSYQRPRKPVDIEIVYSVTSPFPHRLPRLHFVIRYALVLASYAISAAVMGNQDADSNNLRVFVGLTMILFVGVFSIWGVILPRVRDLGLNGGYCFLMLIPCIGPLFMLALLFMPTNGFKSSIHSTL